MTPPDMSIPVIIYGLLAVGLFAGLWFYYDRRDRRLTDADRRKITFHCIRCNHIYVDKAGTETSACPQCGHVNTRLKF